MITQIDIDTTRRLLAQREARAIKYIMDEVEYIAWKMGDISRARAQRLIIAARQGLTTADVKRNTR